MGLGMASDSLATTAFCACRRKADGPVTEMLWRPGGNLTVSSVTRRSGATISPIRVAVRAFLLQLHFGVAVSHGLILIEKGLSLAV